MNGFENFVNLNTYHNWGWGSYLATMYSKMITWTVPENGTYKLSLTGEFDNYLYVVDRTSPYANVFDVNYNEDDEGTNASITNYYRGGKTYAIFYCQYYPASEIGYGEISADISLSISKIS